jgi:hypothetical protein
MLTLLEYEIGWEKQKHETETPFVRLNRWNIERIEETRLYPRASLLTRSSEYDGMELDLRHVPPPWQHQFWSANSSCWRRYLRWSIFPWLRFQEYRSL